MPKTKVAKPGMKKYVAVRDNVGHAGRYWKTGDVVESVGPPNPHFEELDLQAAEREKAKLRDPEYLASFLGAAQSPENQATILKNLQNEAAVAVEFEKRSPAKP